MPNTIDLNEAREMAAKHVEDAKKRVEHLTTQLDAATEDLQGACELLDAVRRVERDAAMLVTPPTYDRT